MTESRPRTFCWVVGLRGAEPQIIFDDPRVGCENTKPIPGSEIRLSPNDDRSLDQLAADHPVSAIAVAS